MNKWELIETIGFISEVMAFFGSGYFYARANLAGFVTYTLLGLVLAISVGNLIKKNDRRRTEVVM